ncbi:hypothetical protein Acr_19g0002520 [Actinidia rufa]|uniref:DUF7054 domain-containing protein n=1 Tax=Actinidia rufa TaxID=165716 RepID=A0A7J0G939_9ERIC|nr:hypothetical protein Acr_19g0002520 [Actinidia rufa]
MIAAGDREPESIPPSPALGFPRLSVEDAESEEYSPERAGGEEPEGRLGEKAASFHGRSPATIGEKLTRPMTVPDLLACRSASAGGGGSPAEGCRKLTKLLLNVTVQRSLGAVQVVMSPESTVRDLIAAALRQYAKEGRRPILESADPSGFDLHYSQFSLESLDREQQLMALGSRNFFLYPKEARAR